MRELPIGFKGGFLHPRKVDENHLVLPVNLTKDIDYASAECYDINLKHINLNQTLAVLKTPLFDHYVIYDNGKIIDYSNYFGEDFEYNLVDIIPKDELEKRDSVKVNYGVSVPYRLYESNGNKILLGLALYCDGLEYRLIKYQPNGKVLDGCRCILDDEKVEYPKDDEFFEIFRRERENLKLIFDSIKTKLF